MENKSITLYNCENSIKREDIESDLEIQETTLHECVHAILKKTILECILNGIKYGSGIEEAKVNKENKSITEIGRGANEGYTEWICEKAGYHASTYKELLNYINILELAIGEEKVMSLGKGNINKNIRKQLSMDKLECSSFLAQIDVIYNIEYNSKPYIYQIMDVLNRYKNKNELSSDEQNAIETEYIQIKEGASKYWENIKGIQDDCVKKGILESSLEEQIEYFKDIVTLARECEVDSIEEINSTIYDKYFKKELEDLMQIDYTEVDKIPLETIKKFDKLHDLFDNTQFLGVEKFREDYKSFDEKLFLSACLKMENAFKEGTLSVGKFKELAELVNRDRDLFNEDFIKYASKTMCQEKSDIVELYLTELCLSNELDKINEYSIVKASANGRSVIAYQRDGKIVEIGNDYLKTSVDDEPTFDFTLSIKEDDKTIINDFLKLKEQVILENPNATIQIINRLVLVNNENNQECYLITDNKILPAKIEEIKDINIKLKEDEPEEIKLPSIPRKSIFNKITDALKNTLPKKEVVTNSYKPEHIATKQVAFRNAMRKIYKNENASVKNIENIKSNELNKQNGKTVDKER